MRVRPDSTLRALAPTVRLGGSPLRLWRLSEAGASLVDRLAAGDDVAVPTGSAVESLVVRLVDAGALHPVPVSSNAPVGPMRGSSSVTHGDADTDAVGFRAADVTVVIPVKDRVGPLSRLLDSLGPTVDAGASVIVVDDASADSAAHADVASMHGATYLRRDVSGGPAAARNEGLAQVTTPLVAFLDSDCTIADPPAPASPVGGSSLWLAPLLALLSEPDVAVVAPRVCTPVGAAASEGGGVLRRYESLRSPLDLGAEPARVAPGTRVSYVPAAALVARTDVLRITGGFDESLRVGEDVDLIWRLVGAGRRVRYEPTSIVEHPARQDVFRWLRQRVDYGSSAALLDARHPSEVAPVRCSPWSATAWALVALAPAPVGPVAGAAVMAASAAALPRKLEGVPASASLRLAAAGHMGAGRQLARAVVRVWWPVAVPAAVVWRPARRALAASAAVVALDAVLDARCSVDDARSGVDERVGPAALATVAALAVLDDAAYGVGVWLGCWRARSFRALRPRFSGSPHRL